MRRVSEDGSGAARMPIDADERDTLDAVVPLPINREVGIRFLDVDRFGIPIAGSRCRKQIGGVKQPGISSFGREQDKLSDGDDASAVVGGPPLMNSGLSGH